MNPSICGAVDSRDPGFGGYGTWLDHKPLGCPWETMSCDLRYTGKPEHTASGIARVLPDPVITIRYHAHAWQSGVKGQSALAFQGQMKAA